MCGEFDKSNQIRTRHLLAVKNPSQIVTAPHSADATLAAGSIRQFNWNPTVESRQRLKTLPCNVGRVAVSCLHAATNLKGDLPAFAGTVLVPDCSNTDLNPR
jgi:hypothetical protein